MNFAAGEIEFKKRIMLFLNPDVILEIFYTVESHFRTKVHISLKIPFIIIICLNSLYSLLNAINSHCWNDELCEDRRQNALSAELFLDKILFQCVSS